jgi:hypothetical protein
MIHVRLSHRRILFSTVAHELFSKCGSEAKNLIALSHALAMGQLPQFWQIDFVATSDFLEFPGLFSRVADCENRAKVPHEP